MKRRKVIWLIVAATLWAWAAVVAGLIFPEIPALLSTSPLALDVTDQTAYSPAAKFELVLFTAFTLFIIFSNPARKIWLITSGIAVLLLLKIIWLAPLLDSHLHWQYPPLAYLPYIYLFTELIKFVLLLLTSYWLYTEISAIARVEERYRLFIASRKNLRKHLAGNS